MPQLSAVEEIEPARVHLRAAIIDAGDYPQAERAHEELTAAYAAKARLAAQFTPTADVLTLVEEVEAPRAEVDRPRNPR